MPHPLHDKRDEINALIGPIEELIAKANEALPVGGASERSYLRAYVVGGLEQALEILSDAVSEIDEFEEPEPDEEEPASPEPEDEDEDEDEDA